jgi:transposase-like protein
LKKLKPVSPIVTPATEVSEKASRRTFSGKYKLRILEEADACTEVGQLGALLRREGLYSSHLVVWRKARRDGSLGALSAKKRGPKVVAVNAGDVRIAELERDLRRTVARAERAEAIVELQKKLSQLLGIAHPEAPDRKDS